MPTDKRPDMHCSPSCAQLDRSGNRGKANFIRAINKCHALLHEREQPTSGAHARRVNLVHHSHEVRTISRSGCQVGASYRWRKLCRVDRGRRIQLCLLAFPGPASRKTVAFIWTLAGYPRSRGSAKRSDSRRSAWHDLVLAFAFLSACPSNQSLPSASKPRVPACRRTG